MDRKFTYEWVGCNFIVTFDEEISYQDIIKANDLILKDVRFDQMEYQIFDYSKVLENILEDNVVEVISRLDIAATVWNQGVKVATVSANPQMRKMLELYNEKMKKTSWLTKSFDCKEDAIKWCAEKIAVSC